MKKILFFCLLSLLPLASMAENYSEIVFEFPENSTIPLTLSLGGSFLEFQEGPITQTVLVKERFYVLFKDGSEPLFSLDLTTWKPFLEFITGKISATIGNSDGNPFINLEAEISTKNN